MVRDLLDDEPIRLNPRVRFRSVGNDGVLVNMDSARVMVLSETGLKIVQSLKEPKSINELSEILAENYDVEPDVAKSDVENYLQALETEGVLV